MNLSPPPERAMHGAYFDYIPRRFGDPMDDTRCVIEVWGRKLSSQCKKPRGHGEDGQLCFTHHRATQSRNARKGV